MKGEVIKVSGPLVVARGLSGARMFEMVRVGELGLFGEIIEIKGEEYSIQTYEETEGIGPGQPVVRTGEPLSVELGPGLIRSIYDGTQRPLDVLAQDFGEYIVRGTQRPALDRTKKWDFVPLARVGDVVKGDILGPLRRRPCQPQDHGPAGQVGDRGDWSRDGERGHGGRRDPEPRRPFGVTMVRDGLSATPARQSGNCPNSDHDDGTAHHRHVLPHNEEAQPSGALQEQQDRRATPARQVGRRADRRVCRLRRARQRMTDVLMEFPHLKDLGQKP